MKTDIQMNLNLLIPKSFFPNCFFQTRSKLLSK